jgi:hypothetical protein
MLASTVVAEGRKWCMRSASSGDLKQLHAST